MTTLPIEQIDLIERLAAAAWPAETVAYRAGWRLRTASAPNRRVNSVLPLGPAPDGSTAEHVAEIEQFYRALDRRPRFQVSPAVEPTDLDTMLLRRGYVVETPVLVQISPLAPIATAPVVGQVRLDGEADAAWMGGAWPDGTVAETAGRRALLERIKPRHRFATVLREGEPAAVALGVLEAEWLGIFCMCTASSHRRKGAAQAALICLARWAGDLGAQSTYLQVEVENLPAISLYEKLGYRTAYTYHYRTAAP